MKIVKIENSKDLPKGENSKDPKRLQGYSLVFYCSDINEFVGL